ncbi:hypothetical protein AMTRI_Chr04g182020 [Amborella trichopoda]
MAVRKGSMLPQTASLKQTMKQCLSSLGRKQRAGEEFGFDHDIGITIPCENGFSLSDLFHPQMRERERD